MWFLLYSSLLLSLCSAQQIIDLKEFRGGNVTNPINATAPYSIFVSATSDLPQFLDQVTLVSDGGTSQTMYELVKRKLSPTSSQLIPWPIERSAFVTANLTDDQMNTLTGFMFISSSKQYQDNNFFVVDVSTSEKLSWSGLGAINTTVLFLNSCLMSTPWHSSTISNWNQSADASVFLYSGIPTDGNEKNNSQIFSNPFLFGDSYVYIDNVEKFSLSLAAFHIKSYKGVSFSISPEYYNVSQKSTSAYTTTGFYMKPINQPEETVEIYTVRDKNHTETVGANIVGSLPANGEVTVGEHEQLSYSSVSVHPTDQIHAWSTQFYGDVMLIASTNGETGEFYVQYYIMQGMPISPVSTSTIQSTTKSSKPVTHLINSLLILLTLFQIR